MSNSSISHVGNNQHSCKRHMYRIDEEFGWWKLSLVMDDSDFTSSTLGFYESEQDADWVIRLLVQAERQASLNDDRIRRKPYKRKSTGAKRGCPVGTRNKFTQRMFKGANDA